MLDNFWLAKCVDVFEADPPHKGIRIAKCNECDGFVRLTPEVGNAPFTEASKAHFFRSIRHCKTCKAGRLYDKDYNESMERLEEERYSE